MIELNWLLLSFLFLYLGQSAFNICVERINLAYSQRRANEVPAGFEEFIDLPKLTMTLDYMRAKTHVGIFEEIVSDATSLVILLSGFLPLLVRWSDRLGLPLTAAGLFFFFVPGFIHLLVELPFSYYSTFVVEENFDFNRSTLKLWVIDHIKGGLITGAFFAVVFAALMQLIVWSPHFWWFWGFLLVAAVQLVIAILYPTVLAPLFNKFEPVRDVDLSVKIRELMEKNGIRVKKILQMDAGTRSRHTNAYFTGIGRTKQIVLFDTLIESHTHEEILAVLAHEVGHFKKRHVPKQLLIFASLSLAAFYAAWLFVRWPLAFTTFGFSAPLIYAGLFLAGVFWSRAGFFIQPFYMAVSRHFEREADTFAANMLGGGASMALAIKRLSAHNLSNLSPHPLYVWFHYSHPPVVQRVAMLEKSESQGGGPGFPGETNGDHVT